MQALNFHICKVTIENEGILCCGKIKESVIKQLMPIPKQDFTECFEKWKESMDDYLGRDENISRKLRRHLIVNIKLSNCLRADLVNAIKTIK